MLRLLAVLLASVLLSACGEHACETELDCVIRCTCEPSGRDVTVGPYECNAFGTCGASFDADIDCVRPCEALPPVFLSDDDDTAPDDDDSGDDDDSSARR
jgi:hypothetical protein